MEILQRTITITKCLKRLLYTAVQVMKLALCAVLAIIFYIPKIQQILHREFLMFVIILHVICKTSDYYIVLTLF